MTILQKRLYKDFNDLILKEKTSTDFSFVENDKLSNILNFSIYINGPKESVFEGLKYKISFIVPNNYPYRPPTIKFISHIFHPNIHNENICLDTIGKTWGLTSTFLKIIDDLISLLKNPNFDDKLNVDVGIQYKNNFDKFRFKNLECSKKN
jgi:ubiquitin-protein ligase